MDIAKYIERLGGAARRSDLEKRWGRTTLKRAVEGGTVVSVGRGRYVLPESTDAFGVASRWGGVLSHRSAAQRHGWGQRLVPKRPDVTFPRNRRVLKAARQELVPHWSDLADDDVVDGVTSKRRTLIDCMRNLPFVDALPIVDSAVKSGDVSREELMAMAEAMRGRGRAHARAIAEMASSQPANAFESTLRAIAALVPGLNAEPQPSVVMDGNERHPDLGSLALGIVIEAESFEWHGEKAALTRDCRRYNSFSLAGLVLYRFSWYQVIFEPQYVYRVLCRAVELARRHANVARAPTAIAA